MSRRQLLISSNHSPALWLEWLITSFILTALVLGTFFQGIDGELLVATEALLLLCVALALWNSYVSEWSFPLTGLTAAITLYWLWLAATLTWSRVPYYSMYLFWWMGSLPLVFWLQTLTAQWTRQLSSLKSGVLILAVALAIGGIAEYFIRGTGPQLMFINKNAYGGLINLVAIPAAAYLMLMLSGENKPRHQTFIIALAVFLLVYAMGLTHGRGALVGFVSAAIIFGFALFRFLPRRSLAITAAIVSLAIVLSQFSYDQTGAIGRFGVASDTGGSVWQRWLIWRSSWDLLADSPWWGIGLGVYSLAWQRYRHPDDSSAGVLAHNDYLQTWIEAGLPGLVLFVSILVAASWTYLRVLKWANKDRISARVEATGLYAGVFAVSVHSLVDFNFYVVPTLILCGLILARLQILRAELEPLRHYVVRPSKLLTPFAYRTLLVLIFAFPLLYFISITTAIYQTRQSVVQAKAGRFDLAEEALLRAARLNPASDDVLMTHADLYRNAMQQIAVTDTKRAELFRLAQDLLDKAIELNPYRLQTYVARAHLYWENPQLLNGDPAPQIRAVFQQALAINPRSLEVRYDYARFLLAQRMPAAAKEVMEGGLQNAHAMFPRFVPYYAMVVKLRRDSGDEAGAKVLEQSIREIIATNPKVIEEK